MSTLLGTLFIYLLICLFRPIRRIVNDACDIIVFGGKKKDMKHRDDNEWEDRKR
jgi:hypothetical protein